MRVYTAVCCGASYLLLDGGKDGAKTGVHGSKFQSCPDPTSAMAAIKNFVGLVNLSSRWTMNKVDTI